MSIQLWTSGDIARELGISGSLVANWGTRPGVRAVPEPYATTQRGARMWTGEQAAQIIHEYRVWKEEQRNRKADQARAAAALERLSR